MYVGSEAREVYLNLYRQPQVNKVAFIGMGTWLRTMTSLFTAVTGRWGKSRWFNDDQEEEARLWAASD